MAEQSRHDVQKERRAAAEAALLASQKHEARLRVALDALLKTEAGLIVWAELHRVCGFAVSSLSLKNDGDVAPLATECKEAQRRVYLHFRERVSPELRHKAELFAEQPKPVK